MFKYFAKKFILSNLNKLLSNIKDNEKIEYWRNKINSIIAFLNNCMKYLEDNEISDEEAEKVVEECKGLF